ncbi:hypothetical protein AVEN_114960-1 [Araneus ventricosus]|uniref:RIIa domain-containing protein n=1 Tax=Araneus ventricosus TaxID=182803 RepID=A0A4Y2DA48_ARAVE|nr:hypothetical protein AVEN_114960-1 [Araneus ventricosus]
MRIDPTHYAGSRFLLGYRNGGEVITDDGAYFLRERLVHGSVIAILYLTQYPCYYSQQASHSATFQDEGTMDIEYLKTSIGGYLSRALTELAIRRPERPVEFLAYYLISLHEKELELQKAEEQKKKKKSTSRVKVTAAPTSDTNQVVSSVLAEIMDKCTDLYDPEVKDSSVNILKTSDVDILDRRLTAPTIIDDVSHLDENIARLVIGDEKEFTAEVQNEIPHSYELNTEALPKAIQSSSQQFIIPGTSTNDLQIDSD